MKVEYWDKSRQSVEYNCNAPTVEADDNWAGDKTILLSLPDRNNDKRDVFVELSSREALALANILTQYANES